MFRPYYQAVGAQQLHEVTQDNLRVAREVLEMVRARQKAGAASELDVNLSRGLVVDAELLMEPARLDATDARRGLAQLLGIITQVDALLLLDPLPEAPAQTPDAEALITLARERRLVIRAARRAVAVAETRLREQWRMIFPAVAVGVALERAERKRLGGRDLLADTARSSIAAGGLTAPEIQPRSERRRNTDLIIGPSVDLELPIFDQNQAQIAKARYMYQKAVKTLDALDRSVAQEVRSAVDRAMTGWKLVQVYRERSIPLTQSNLDLSRKSFQAGTVSFLAVLEAQRSYLDNRRRYTAVLQATAVTIPELERTIGLPFHKLVAEEPGGSPRESEHEEER